MVTHPGAVSSGTRALLVFALFASAAAEEAPASLAACGMAATLMGTVVFMMSVFYLLNHNDEDMRRYSANVVSSTISIFCAVLMFQAINGWIEEKLGMEEWTDLNQFWFDFGHMVLWFLVMQYALAKTSGALLEDEQKKVEHPELKELDMKCYATLLAHMTGFAAINAFAQLQQTEFFRSYSLVSFLVVPIALIVLYAMQRATDAVREKIALGDGEKDEFERLWDEETEEAENDVMGLVLSFTATQSIRFLVGQHLPNVEGVEETDNLLGHTLIQKFILMLFAVGFAVLTFLSVYLKPEETEEHMETLAVTVMHGEAGLERLETPLLPSGDLEGKLLGDGARVDDKNKLLDMIATEDTLDRLWEAMSVAASMTMAWCFFFGGRWFLAGTPNILADNTETHSDMMMLTLLQALVLSALSFSLIRVLDIIEDRAKAKGTGSKKVEEGIEQIIKALGILVGFAWEQCFDTSVTAISSNLSNPSEMKLLFAVFVFVVLVPAWKMWILPMDVCWGWKNAALAQIPDEEALEKFMLTLRIDFAEKKKEGEEKEVVIDLKEDAKLHASHHDDVKNVHVSATRGSTASFAGRNPALANIHDAESLESFIKTLRADFEEKQKQDEKRIEESMDASVDPRVALTVSTPYLQSAAKMATLAGKEQS